MTVALRIHVEPLPEGMWDDDKRIDAFEEMYRRCYPPLVDLCRRMLCGRGDAEAVAQEAFIRAWSSLDRFSGARPFWPWVATIARRLCIDNRRRLDRESLNLHMEAATCDVPAVSPDELVEADEEYRSAVRALKGLKPAEQRVITLRDVYGWSYGDIARFEGVSIESIRGSLKRARASLRKSYVKLAPALVCGRSLPGLRARMWRVLGTPRASGVAAQLGRLGEAMVGIVALAVAVTGTQADTPHGVGSTAGMSSSGPTATAAAQHARVDVVPARQMTATAEGSAVRPDEPRPAPGDADGGLPVGLLPADPVATPEDAIFTDVVASPAYERDGTIFAAGTATQGCPYATCPVIFRTRDRGATWQRLRAVGYAGGNVVLPPSYPEDPRIFVAGSTALHVSRDGGESFEVGAPIGGPVSISPTFADDNRILMGHAPGWEYRADLAAMHPSGIVVPSTSVANVPVFSPDFATDARIFIGGMTSGADGVQQATVFRCTGALCDVRAPLRGIGGSPNVAVSPQVATDGVVMAWRGSALFRSSDAGRSFSSSSLPLPGFVQGVAFDNAGHIFVGVRKSDDQGTRGGLLASFDNGRSWRQLGAQADLRRGVESIAAMPGGRLIAGLSGTAGGGLLCSSDGGDTWARRCTA